MSKRRLQFSCENNANDFCNVCGQYMLRKSVRKFTTGLKQHYLDYFGMHAQTDKAWTPEHLCSVCQSALSNWAVNGRFVKNGLLYV